MKPQAISVRIARVVWHGEGRMPAGVLEQAIAAAITAHVEARVDGTPMRQGAPGTDRVARQVADTVVGRLTKAAGAPR